MKKQRINLSEIPSDQKLTTIQTMVSQNRSSAFNELANQELEQDVQDILVSLYPELAYLPDVEMNRKLEALAGSSIKDVGYVLAATAKMVVDFLGRTNTAGIAGGATGGIIANQLGASPEVVMGAIAGGALTGVVGSLVAEIITQSRHNISPRQPEEEQLYNREYLAVRDYKQNLSEIRESAQIRKELQNHERLI